MAQSGGTPGGTPGGSLGPEKIWPVIALVLVGFVAWNSLKPAPDAGKEPTAAMNVVQDGEVQVAHVNRQDCQRQDGRVWVVIDDGPDCISYVTAGTISASEPALLFFNGDVPEDKLKEQLQAGARKQAQGWADSLNVAHGVPVVVVGRPGLMGSTGFHLSGGRRDEALVMEAAVDALKDKLGLKRLALAGQSGGARIIAQLMVMGRRDIGCAAMGSGAYDLPRLQGGGTARTSIFGDPGKRYMVPMLQTQAIVADPQRRCWVIGDPRDTIVPFSEQRAWADKLAALGHHAVLIEAKATDPDFHGMSAKAGVAAALCAKGRSDGEIRSAVDGTDGAGSSRP